MKEKFPEAAFSSLLNTYNRHFDSVCQRNELIVLYSAPDNEICNRPLHLMLKYMIENKLHLAMPEIYKLLLLILAIPTTEHTFSILKRIKTFTRPIQGQKRLMGLALVNEKGPTTKTHTESKIQVYRNGNREIVY